MLIALGLPAKVLITAAVVTAIPATVTTGVLATMSPAQAASAPVSAAASVQADFVDGGARSAQSTTLAPGEVSYRYVRVSNNGATPAQVVVTVTGTGGWADSRGLLATVSSCAGSWDQGAHKCPDQSGAVLRVGDQDVSSAPSGALGLLAPAGNVQLQVSVRIDPTAGADHRSGSFRFSTSAVGVAI